VSASGAPGADLLACMARPRGISVVGASPRPGTLGERPLRYLRAHGYTGPLYPVNPRHAEVAGLACYPTLSAVPGPVDVALIAVPATAVAPVVAECAGRGVALAVVLSSGFAEAGAHDRQLELRRLAGPVRLLGPNCQGYLPGAVPAPLAAVAQPLSRWRPRVVGARQHRSPPRPDHARPGGSPPGRGACSMSWTCRSRACACWI
jgi:acyl-CoA synthetase (NDP forming)